MATEGTKFQINYKLSDGTLINLYAGSATELEAGLADLAMNATNIRATGNELHAAVAHNSPTTAAVAAITQSYPAATPVAVTSTGQDAASSVKMCKHGQMSYRTGTGQKGPWQGYMCAAPKGAPDKCETIWVR